MSDGNELSKNTATVVKWGSGVAGGVVALTVGAAGGPVAGIAAGRTAAVALERVCSDLVGRQLSKRQQRRAGTLTGRLAADLDEKLLAEELPRSDGFMEGDPSPFEQTVETAVFNAINEVEERKLPHMAHLVAALPFRTDISRGSALQLLRIADDLSYDEFCVLGVAARADRGDPDPEAPAHVLLQLTMERIQALLYLVTYERPGGHADPAHFVLSELGTLLSGLLRLDELRPDDVQAMADRFRPPGDQ